MSTVFFRLAQNQSLYNGLAFLVDNEGKILTYVEPTSGSQMVFTKGQSEEYVIIEQLNIGVPANAMGDYGVRDIELHQDNDYSSLYVDGTIYTIAKSGIITPVPNVFHPIDWFYAVPIVIDEETQYFVGNADGKGYIFKGANNQQAAIKLEVTDISITLLEEVSSPGGTESDYVDKDAVWSEGMIIVDNYGKQYTLNPYELGDEPWLSPLQIERFR